MRVHLYVTIYITVSLYFSQNFKTYTLKIKTNYISIQSDSAIYSNNVHRSLNLNTHRPVVMVFISIGNAFHTDCTTKLGT